MYLGKQIRLERIINRNNGRTIIVPMDHGVSMGALPGLIDMKQTVDDLAEGGADAVLMHKGLIRCGCRHRGNDIGLIMHLSASTDLTPSKNAKALVGTVEEAIRHGADAVSCHVNLGDPDEAAMLSDLGRVAEACDNWGMPLIAMFRPSAICAFMTSQRAETSPDQSIVPYFWLPAYPERVRFSTRLSGAAFL